VSEVGPRDGLQSIKRAMPTEAKLRWIRALAAAGLREIEVCSFVPAKLLPQMADAAEVVVHARTLPGLTVVALVPNRRGAEAAIAAGAHKLTITLSASAARSMADVRRTREQMVEEVRAIVAVRAERFRIREGGHPDADALYSSASVGRRRVPRGSRRRRIRSCSMDARRGPRRLRRATARAVTGRASR